MDVYVCVGVCVSIDRVPTLQSRISVEVSMHTLVRKLVCMYLLPLCTASRSSGNASIQVRKLYSVYNRATFPKIISRVETYTPIMHVLFPSFPQYTPYTIDPRA